VAPQQTILFVDESGFYPLPSVVRTYAPVGQTPILRAWWTRDHLSAISAMSPEGKLYFQSQDRALDSADVVAFLEHLLREVSGWMVLMWDGAPIPRRHLIQEFLANGAAQRVHVERLPAYAPELKPGEGLWQPRKGGERRHLWCVEISHLRGELRDAVKRVRRKPRMLQGCFQGAGLEVFMYGSVSTYIVTNMPMPAAVIIAAVAHPKARSRRELTRAPMTSALLVSRMTRTINGGASTPLSTAA
jgi:transposase